MGSPPYPRHQAVKITYLAHLGGCFLLWTFIQTLDAYDLASVLDRSCGRVKLSSALYSSSDSAVSGWEGGSKEVTWDGQRKQVNLIGYRGFAQSDTAFSCSLVNDVEYR